uniref:Uncharacterized protein n=1 Tax=Lygus hesperus TaxID=30085 RepID=A0A0A9YCV6_LYGHE
MASFPLRNGKMKLKKRMKKLKRVKTPKKEIVVVEHSRTSCEQPQILVGETLESSTKTTETQESLSSNIANIVLPHPNTVQNNLSMASPSKSTSSLLCHDILPSGTAQCSAPVVHNYKELNVDPCEDEDASPQFSPHPPREKGSVSPELQMQAPSNLSGSFMPVAPEWGNQCSLGTMVVQSSSSNGGSFSVSPQGTPRPITERSRSFSNLRQTSKPRARRDSHPALPPAVQSPTPVDLSFRRKKSRSHGSTSQLGVNPEGPMISSNIGKLDLNGKNPTFYTSYPGYKVTYDLAKNQVVLLNQTSASCVNQPVDTIPPMSVPMNEQLSVPVPSSSIPIRPIPKVRPAVVGTYPPLSGSRVKKDDFVPTAKSSFNEYSRLLCPQSLSAFHAMKSNNASSRSSNPANQHKKTDHNPLLFSHGTHFMLTPAEVSNIALLCPSTSATTLPSSNRRNKSTRSTRIKPDVISPSSKTSFTNLKSHTDTGRSTDVRANEIICHKPLFNQSQANSLPFYPENSYKLSCVNNMNPLVHPSLLRPPGVLSVASERPYKSDRVRNDQVLIGRNQEALQKVVREFNEGMNSMKDSNAVLNTKELKSDDGPNHNRSGVPVKALNLSDIGERNISEDCTSTINSTPPNVIDIEVEIMSSQLPTESKGVKLDHRKTILTEKGAEIPPNQSSKSNKVCATEVKVAQDSEPVLRCQQFSDQGVDKCHPIAGCMGDSEKRETLEVVTISSAPNMPSVSENCSDTLIDEEHNIECPDHNISKQPSTKESPIVSIESCPSPDSVIDVVSLPITESKDLENQVDPNCSGELDNVGNKTSEEQMILVTEIQSSSEITQVAADIPSRKLGVPELPQSVSETQSSAENPSYTQLFIPEQPLSVSEKVETVPEMDHNIIHESQTAVNLTSATDIPESKYVEATDHGKPAAVLLPEISLIQLDKSEQDNISNNIKETDVHINDYTATKIDESTQIHSKQQLQKLQQPEPSIKSKIELPTENCGIPLKPDDQVNSPMESVGTAIVPPPASSSLTSIEQNLGLPTDKMAPEIIDTCGYSVPFKEAKVDSVQFGVNGNYSCPIDDSIKPYSNDETDTMLMPVSIESQSQNTEKQADKPTDQIVPEKSHVCTDHLLLSEGVCQKDDSVKPESNEDTNTTLIPLTTESQIQNTEKYGTSDIVCFSEVSEDGRSGLLSSAVHTSKSDANLVDVSERLLGSAVDKSVDSDGTCDDACNGSSAGPDPNTDLKSSTPIGFTELRGKADIQLQSPQPLEQASKVSEAPEDPITSLTPQNSPEVTELPTDLCNQDLIPLDVVRDHESSCMSNLNTTLSSSPDATLNVSESRQSINSSVHSFTDESLILTTVPNSVSKECSDSSTGNNNSNLICEDQIAKMESCNDRKTIEEKSVGSSISFCYSRKRKLAGDSQDEDVESIKSIDSINCRIKKRKQAHAKVKIRPISPTTVDEIVKSGIKIKHSELQDIVKCWQEYCRSHERVSRAMTVGRAGKDEATKITGREESRRPAGQSRRFEDDLSRPSTSRELRNDPSSPLNIPSPLISMRDPKEPKNVTAYLLEREREINRGLKRTTRVGELFARGVKIHQRDCNVKHSRVESFASSRRSSTIADALSTLPCVRPTIHRSYSWIVEHLRERRKKMDYMESMNIQSCKDFINGVSKDAVAGCQTTLSLAMATHSRLSAVHPPVTNWPPTNLGVTTITVISSDSEDSNAGGTEHTMKDRDEVRKRVRRKVGTTVNLPCSCQSPSQNSNSHVCPTCRKEKSHAHGASSPIRPSSTSLYTKVSNMQRREPERVMECAAAVGGGEETVIVPDSNSVHLLKALMTLAGRRPPTSDTYAPPYSLSCDDPRPTSHTEVFSLPYEKELISTRVTVTPDPPSHDAGPHPLPETVRGSSTQYLQEKPAPEEAPCIFERNDTDLQVIVTIHIRLDIFIWL